MNKENIFEELMVRYPQLAGCRDEVVAAFELLRTSLQAGGTILTCGNGGSAADAEHIVGELMKSFRRRRAVDSSVLARLPPDVAVRLEGALPAISLGSMTSFLSAHANDVAWEMAYAQETYALGRTGDVLWAISTSGNSMNCVNAARVAKAKGLRVVALTGASGGVLAEIADVCVRVPETETFKVQELHLPVYHALCAALEAELFVEETAARQQVRVQIVHGHRVASGLGGDARFPGGTIHLQTPYFKALGLDLSPYYPGTINVSVAPLSYTVVKSALTFEKLAWTDAIPPETFSFFNVWRVKDDGTRVKGLVYYPHPETKVQHFQKPDTLELLFPKMDDVAYGQEMLLEFNSSELAFA